MFKVERPALLAKILEATWHKSVLLTGSPGVGKSWATAQFIRDCKAAKRPVLALAAEDFDVRSVEELGSTLGLNETPLTFLENLGQGAVLVIDGLDALRAEQAQRPIRDFISLVGATLPQCAIVVSIRTYDLQQSAELQNLFLQSRSGLITRDFIQITVDSFSDEDLDRAAEQEPQLKGLLEKASGEFHELLRNPFNLHLAVRIMKDSSFSDDLSEIRSQEQLLNAYWRYRIEGRDDSHDRKSVLRVLLRKMVENNSLSVSEDAAYSFGQSTLYNVLQSDELLRRSATDRISFAHNILFDYAVARLLLDEDSVLRFIAEDPSRTIFFRPSLSFFFHHLWSNDRGLFWRVAFKFLDSPGVPARAQVIPAVSIYQAAQQLTDLDPLLDSSSNRVAGVAMLLRAVQTFGGLQSKRRALWVALLDKLTSRLSLDFVNEYLALISAASEGASAGDNNTLGSIARTFLRWMWGSSQNIDESTARQLADMGAIRVLPVILRFYGSDLEASKQIVHDVLDRCGQRMSGSHEASSLAQRVSAVAKHDPLLAVEVYKRLFSHREMSEEKTLIGGSTVLQFTSTRRQDYSLALYGLQQEFDKFLDIAPVHAVLAAAESIEAEFQTEDRDLPDPRDELTFPCGTHTIAYLPDRSEIWDSGGHPHLSLTLLDSALRYAAKRLSGQTDDAVGLQIIATIIRKSKRGVAWKHLLEAAITYPSVFYKHISGLIAIPEFISAPEVTISVGNLLKVIHSQGLVTKADEQAIEKALSEMPRAKLILRYEKPEAIRNRLLMCIPVGDLISENLKKLAEEIAESKETRKNEPYFQSRAGSVSADEFLRLQGIDPDKEDNVRVLEPLKILETFEIRHVNESPSIEECALAEPLIRQVERLIPELPSDHPFFDRARGALCGAAETVLKTSALPKDGDLTQLCRAIVLRGASDPIPEFDPKHHATFDWPSWGGGQPRIESAQGLSHFLWNWGLDSEVIGTLEKLCDDRVPAVRLQAAQGLLGLYKHEAFEEFWRLTQHMLSRETTSGVTLTLVSTLGRIAGRDPERVMELLQPVIESTVAQNKKSELMGGVLDILVWLDVVQNDTAAGIQLARFEDDPIRFHAFIGEGVFRVAQYLRSEKETERRRARAVLEKFLVAVYRDLAKLEGKLESDANRDSFFNLLHIVEDIAFRVYSVLDVNPSLRGASNVLTSSAQRDLYFELKIIIELLTTRSEYGGKHYQTGRAADLLLEILDVVLTYDPMPVVRYAAAVCRASAPMNYPFDAMAIAKIVKFVEHVIADHKDTLRDPTTAKELGDLLDIFVKAGWPEAMRLVFTIDQAVR